MAAHDFVVSIVSGVLAGVVCIGLELLLGPVRTKRWWLRLGAASVALSILAFALLSYTDRPRKASPVLADFNSCRPLNIYGLNWHVFNDNPWNGNSNVTLSTPSATASDGGQCYLMLDYYLGSLATILPHTGMFTYFAFPGDVRDFSGFDGIQLYIWHVGTLPPNVRVFLHLRPSELIHWSDGYFQYDLTSSVRPLARGGVTRVPFSQFEPSAPLRAVGFSTSPVRAIKGGLYQISVAIIGTGRGKTSSGKLAIDDISFY